MASRPRGQARKGWHHSLRLSLIGEVLPVQRFSASEISSGSNVVNTRSEGTAVLTRRGLPHTRLLDGHLHTV